jgi:outer membrane protein OmpA-like peptidoglycan-associated protein
MALISAIIFAQPCGAAPAQQGTFGLSDDWVYYGSQGRAKIVQSDSRVTMELTWTPNTAPSPHYKIAATLLGLSLDGTWLCVTPSCGGQGGKFHADLSSNGNEISVSRTDDPYGQNEWNGLILERAPKNAGSILSALLASGTVEIYDIHFDVDQTIIKPESKPILDEVAALLKQDRSLRLEISGHTDNTGTSQHNIVLSTGRANAVVATLVKSYGIPSSRLIAKGYGDTKPVAPNDSDRNRANNRRVELKRL